ncbi:MAG TPA: FtsX-like permease family protein [Caulobacteraceae bacterium]
MKFLPLVWAGIWRKPGRAVLTLLSVVNAFLLFGVLQGFASGLNHAVAETHADVLLSLSRISTEPLPVAQIAQIRMVQGVRAATPMVPFISTYRTPTSIVPADAVDPSQILAVDPGLTIPPSMIAALQRDRTGAIVSRLLASRFGWKVGDRVPLRALTVTNRDGSPTWPVDIVGVFSSKGGTLFKNAMLINFDYVDQGRTTNAGTAPVFVIRIDDPNHAGPVAASIDKLFANSAHETKTATVRQIAQNNLKQIGDIGLVINAIVAAVFFALLFSVGALMMQSVRERTPELAVLKTLGFTDRGLMGLILAESLTFCLVSAAIGLGLAAMLFPVARQLIGFNIQAGPLMLVGLALAVGLALISGLPPAVRAMRLQVVDALAGR